MNSRKQRRQSNLNEIRISLCQIPLDRTYSPSRQSHLLRIPVQLLTLSKRFQPRQIPIIITLHLLLNPIVLIPPSCQFLRTDCRLEWREGVESIHLVESREELQPLHQLLSGTR